jgi:hypothetical protein
MRKVILLTLLFLSPVAVAPEPVDALGCMGIQPICMPGLHPACICYDYFRNNCSWQCVR